MTEAYLKSQGARNYDVWHFMHMDQPNSEITSFVYRKCPVSIDNHPEIIGYTFIYQKDYFDHSLVCHYFIKEDTPTLEYPAFLYTPNVDNGLHETEKSIILDAKSILDDFTQHF